MTDLEKAAKEMLLCVDRMLRDGEWYSAQKKADALRAALAQQAEPVTGSVISAAEMVISAWDCANQGPTAPPSLRGWIEILRVRLTQPVPQTEHTITTKVGDIVGFRAPGLKKGDKLYAAPQQQAERAVVISPPAELKFIISSTRMSWDQAMAWAADQGLRLATVDEMRGMKLQACRYWSGTECSQSDALYFNTGNGNPNYVGKYNALFAIAVPVVEP
jgi:hypothetical protein